MLQRRRHAHRRVAAADLALFTRQLATLVQAAMPLETCLQAVSEQSEKLHVKSLGMALRSRIQEGYTLSDSLREHPRVFDSLFCSMVAAGEKSGHLDVVLNRLADYTEQRQRLKSRLLQAMLYPLVLLVVATGVVTILLTAVVPKIIEQFDHLGHALAERGENIQVWIDPVVFNDLLNWLNALDEKYALRVTQIDASAAEKTGMVNVQRLEFGRG
ncbi:type II secretion system F family protein [Escherichia coli]|nr:type II secretion system F family protein [Escherichia coli]